jgi:hypothetical protein
MTKQEMFEKIFVGMAIEELQYDVGPKQLGTLASVAWDAATFAKDFAAVKLVEEATATKNVKVSKGDRYQIVQDGNVGLVTVTKFDPKMQEIGYIRDELAYDMGNSRCINSLTFFGAWAAKKMKKKVD